ncbi:MAG: Integral membrane sensor signal transduction histidine kinase [Candidatus Moranbacteria bacterium GW2011_GWE2_35_2-]|nr:MAG: Integral membrane sensor signal transduction histidine kinase [Candidatus Moranbacteria bacterium GW2011_GWE2_35_2-]KKQ22564.1 MAG: Integral membrane sensor signal transduction histidine kinase [Candidatus Moranbacteria bacterium GW2011_GWF2_37_11]KKQ28967.1 MAG: Integral membrane sensor signal transduction histidine kinase [Candidatus Moranbacteria bacterium GW2011_GWD1_37_17]KKQ30497.1 MAG: Integral membrane sensor signal transduction histidine kinase [Candidatus Moranbacteria bacteriu
MKIVNDLNIRKQADELGVSIWQAPSFLFLLMGIIVVVAMTVVYFASMNYGSPEILIFSEFAVVIIIFTIGTFIIRNVEYMAAANKIKSEFISMASHQLKTPIAELSWASELLISKYKKGLGKKQLDLIGEISKANAHMSRLVGDLLDVARLDRGALLLAQDKINIVNIVKEVHEADLPLATAMGVKVDVIIPGSLPEIIADKRRIKVAIDNLISNAIKYTADGGYVEVRLEKDGDKINFCVKDNGIGIPEKQQDKVFEKFFRSDNSAKYKIEGTGLGLYIVKNYVEQSGGKIWFKSIENVGSSFCFSLPIVNKK